MIYFVEEESNLFHSSLTKEEKKNSIYEEICFALSTQSEYGWIISFRSIWMINQFGNHSSIYSIHFQFCVSETTL